ncbi:MAG TPA: glycosyltransferase family 1 protein [Bryobacteraceae bacterium]|nr:glycosyltransferase family 1 protein [Bryobacteraceae bacterium]
MEPDGAASQTRRIHVAIDARRIRDFGIGVYIRSLVHALAAIDTSNRYTIIGSSSDLRTLVGLPENFHPMEYARSDKATLDHAAFPMFLHQLAPDLVHIPLNRIPLLLMRPYVVTVHDMSSILFDHTSGIRMQLRRYRLRRGLERARRVIAVSDATRRDVQNLMGIPPNRIRRIYNAPDPGFYDLSGHSAEDHRRILERYQIQYPYLLYAGNVRKHKNVPRLVEAFAVLREQLAGHPEYRDLRLVIIGNTISQHPGVRQTVIKSRVEHLVRFLGFVPFETLRCFYESAAAFVFPSRYEGFGLPPLEAMACGTPVVTSNVSSLPEVVGDAALLVNPENVFDIARGIREVLLDEALRADLIAKGRAQASRFSWERTARAVLEIYRDSAAG